MLILQVGNKAFELEVSLTELRLIRMGLFALTKRGGAFENIEAMKEEILAMFDQLHEYGLPGEL